MRMLSEAETVHVVHNSTQSMTNDNIRIANFYLEFLSVGGS